MHFKTKGLGVPIPVFFDKEGNPLLDANLIRHLATKVEKHGSDLWFSSDEDSLIDGYELDDEWKSKELFKGKDTLDVWIDQDVAIDQFFEMMMTLLGLRIFIWRAVISIVMVSKLALDEYDFMGMLHTSGF